MSGELPLDARLEKLPRRVQMALRQLLQLGHVSVDVVAQILDAAELAGEYEKLLGFAVAYLHLSTQGVPIHDVIRMAKSQNRSLNLCWSAARWRDEHDRLSRAETLRRLAEQNVQYDLSRFDPLMPADLNGYLIRSSRRLGMEGLRQRHCVASYHELIKAGECAIACVFLNHQRWTVELGATGDAAHPLRVRQMRTRFNGKPSDTVRAQIHALFGDSRNGVTACPSIGPRAYRENLRRILPVLREQGIQRVVITFDGCGDSGSIDDAQFDPSSPTAEAVIVEVIEIVMVREGDGWKSERQLIRLELAQAIYLLAEDFIEETGIDWSDQDGGFGELNIDVEAGTVSLEISTRFTDTLTAYETTRDIMSEEEI
ncbi:MAG: DUF6878 family protein [Steroidobacteraceae bacterium]